MGFIAAREHLPEYGETAALLLQMTDEMNFDVRSVKTVPGGFECHDAVAAVLIGGIPEVPVVIQTEKAVRPAWMDEPMPEVNVTLGEDGKYYAPVPDAAGREEIRAWAVEAGLAPAPVGKLKQSVIEAFRVAHPDRATVE